MSIRHFVDAAHAWTEPTAAPPAVTAASAPVPLVDVPSSFLPATPSTGETPSLAEWLRFLGGDSAAVFPPRRSESPVVYLPEYHEPRYAYPLLVWVQSPGRTADADFHRLMEGVSDRNYVGLAFRPASLSRSAAESGRVDLDDLQSDADRLAELVTAARKHSRLHNERIFLVGSGAAATWALRFGLHRPEWFAGIAAFDATWPGANRLFARYRALRGKRVLLGAGRGGLKSDLPSASEAGARMLHAAGMTVCRRNYAGIDPFDPAKLSDLNRWVMREIYPARETA